jgi:hypothetical protein
MECGICLEKIDENNNYAITPCGHKFCFNCILQSIQSINTCPYCREILLTEEENNEENNEEDNQENNLTYLENTLKYVIRIITDGLSIKELFYITSFLLINNYFYIRLINNKIDNIDIMSKNNYFYNYLYNQTFII